MSRHTAALFSSKQDSDMKKTRWKRIGLIALIIALVTMLIVGVSMVSAIAKHTSEKSESSPHSGTSSDQKVNNELFDSQLFNATHNRSRWLYDLINASGRAKIDNESDGNAIFRTAYRLGLIDTVSEDDLFLPLDRLFIAQTTVRALGYPERTVGDLADVPPAQKSVMGTMAYYGYFVPDHEDMVYPNAAISAKEYERLKTELNRYRALKGKNVLAFGDSIMHGNGNHEEGIAVLIAAKYGMTVNDYSVPGASFGDRGERSRICNQIRVAQMADEKADLILLNGGTNDMGHTPFGENDKGFDMTDADETTFTGGVCQTLHSSMVEVTSAVERYGGDSLFQSALCDCLSDNGCGVDTVLALALSGKDLVVRRSCNEGDTLLVIDYLGIDLLVASEDNQSWPFSSSIDMLADAVMDPSSSFNFVQCHICVLLII